MNTALGLRIADTVHVTSGFADDTQRITRNASALLQLLDVVETFCPVSGFKLNREKTEILTYATMPPSLPPRVIQASTPVKSLGLLLAGKVVVLQAVCLPLLWYQIAFTAPTKRHADASDRAMLQFIHGEPITGKAANHFRGFSQEIVFLPKDPAGMGLTRAMPAWQARVRSIMLRVVQTTQHEDKPTPSWARPGIVLLETHYQPWGSFNDRLHADPTLTTIKTFMDDPRLLHCKPMEANAACTRCTNADRPAKTSTSTTHTPLWHNALLPEASKIKTLQQGYARQYTRKLAMIGITHLLHLPFAAEDRDAFARSVLSRSAIRRPLKQVRAWIRSPLGTIAKMYHPEAPSLNAPASLQGTVLWLEHHFYEQVTSTYDPAKPLAASLHQPITIHPKYSDFVNKVLLGGLALRGRLCSIMPVALTCLFCEESETHQHLLVDCFSIRPLLEALGIRLPATLATFLFDEPKMLAYHTQLGQIIWPTLRAAVWFSVWKERNNRIFRPDMKHTHAAAIGHRAATVVRWHLRHWHDQDDSDEQLLRHSAAALAAKDWPRDNIIPAPRDRQKKVH
ncbi:hypothetical protein ACHHYP_14387 [Achlya hypogyna]|uniref:Reverse transcriptase domain-containing protein n=1 Tax=Achlya hypogyna TaxID=1202772 RepID=A0A1V9YD86_ACHHY|nr:hypothetical protein ACHHYP_14387 [Achlya hypogyna]